MAEPETDVTIFDDEELLSVAKGAGVGGALKDVAWLSPVNLVLGFLTAGIWYLVPIGRALVSGGSSSKEYIITDERIVESSGIVGKSTTQYDFEELVGDIHTNQSFLQGLMNVGDIEFEVRKTRATGESSGTLGERERSQQERSVSRETIRLEGVKNHTEVADTIRRIHRN